MRNCPKERMNLLEDLIASTLANGLAYGPYPTVKVNSRKRQNGDVYRVTVWPNKYLMPLLSVTTEFSFKNVQDGRSQFLSVMDRMLRTIDRKLKTIKPMGAK